MSGPKISTGRMARSITVFVLSLAFLAAAAQSASAGFVAPYGSDAGNDCNSKEAPCATIQHAVDEGEAGDSIDVGPGVYTEEVTIDKPLLTLNGPDVSTRTGEPQAVLDGGTGTAVRPEANRITIRGMTVEADASGTAIRTSGADVDYLRVQEDIISGAGTGVRLEAGGEEDEVGYNLIDGIGEGIQVNGTAYSGLNIRWNRFVDPQSEYAVLAQGGTTIEALGFEGNELPAPTRIAARVKNLPSKESYVDANSFASKRGPQLAIDSEAVRIMENTFEGGGSASCLEILGDQDGLLPSTGAFMSSNEFTDCDPYGVDLGPKVDDVRIVDNEFPGSYNGVTVRNTSEGPPWDVTGHIRIHTNRFVGTTNLAVENSAAGTLDAMWNWWGCNAGPGAAGCDRVSGGVDAENNQVLSALIGPRKKPSGFVELPTGTSITLNPGEQAEVAAFLIAEGVGMNSGVPTEKSPIGFSSSLGGLSPETGYFSNGWTTATFTAGSTPGEGSIAISMDNQQIRVPVTIPGTTTTRHEAPPMPATSSPQCQVPKLEGRKLKAAKKAITAADCKLGKVTKKGVTTKTGKVVKQSPKVGRTVPAGSKVSLTLG